MPKLSKYVAELKHQSSIDKTGHKLPQRGIETADVRSSSIQAAPQAPLAAEQVIISFKCRPDTSLPDGYLTRAPCSFISQPSTSSSPQLDQQLTIAAHRLKDAYTKRYIAAYIHSTQMQHLHLPSSHFSTNRLQHHGPRCYRHPDGSLHPFKPHPNPYALSNRSKWAPLVNHCRTHGGDRVFEATKRSPRYGINVSKEQHLKYLQNAELEPEELLEAEANKEEIMKNPLDDPRHAFNGFYSQGAAIVFSEDQRGRLL